MTTKIIDGVAIAKWVRAEWKAHVDALRKRAVIPGLAVVIVGEDSASQIYVRHKVKACADIGIHSARHTRSPPTRASSRSSIA